MIQALGEEIDQQGRLNFNDFAAIVQRVRQKTGLKGRALFHPIRVALTGQTSGLELDKFIPLIEEGATLSWPRPMLSCQARLNLAQEWLR